MTGDIGNIGNIVNGAGLAMTTNEDIEFHGGGERQSRCGRQTTKDTITQALRIMTRDQRVKAILVNMEGREIANLAPGLTRCDMIAESISQATSELDTKMPMVLEEADSELAMESYFGEAARRVVELAKSA
ncbi:uncharacterized protein UV8b_04762 [Ustilaginoidea virens]|uniref:ATP-citrate synthase/succinyl-CoA ligase C-terminal domain-containing protein n=1 Tax=Ustilaginoidea virens TaxID=1159556 RepID=A0A8E5MI11_USTVR|nr:uncharacterized protein UV8b_04762 [Ustilaginoidea virens]QUC20521.1 hypothetical protein UV8b_04762 [Ustilaginoidea virens]